MNEMSTLLMANHAFDKMFKKGKRINGKLAHLIHRDHKLLCLSELTDIYKPEGEFQVADQDIPVDLIIGSESRGNDFAEGFFPTHIWMKDRWITVWKLMHSQTLSEPILALEYGGLYFVRDGNHRVSTAKQLQQAFIRAKLTSLSVPFKLDADFRRSQLPCFRHLAGFQKKTNFFNSVHEAEFDIRRRASWPILEKEINCWNPRWYKKNAEAAQAIPVEDRNRHWYNNVYQYILKYITHESLHYMYPGWGSGDVVLKLIQLWNSFPEPDNYTIEDMYRIFLANTRRQRFLLLPFQLLVEAIRTIFRTENEERCLFLEMSRIKSFRPEFRLPADVGKRYWRRLHTELFKTHYAKMKSQLKRSPRLHELVEDWYEKQWLPKTE